MVKPGSSLKSGLCGRTRLIQQPELCQGNREKELREGDDCGWPRCSAGAK